MTAHKQFNICSKMDTSTTTHKLLTFQFFFCSIFHHIIWYPFPSYNKDYHRKRPSRLGNWKPPRKGPTFTLHMNHWPQLKAFLFKRKYLLLKVISTTKHSLQTTKDTKANCQSTKSEHCNSIAWLTALHHIEAAF